MMCRLECKTSCRIRGIVYEMVCADCRIIIYRGQTSRSGYERINEHFDEWNESKKRINQKNRKYDDKRLPVQYYTVIPKSCITMQILK